MKLFHAKYAQVRHGLVDILEDDFYLPDQHAVRRQLRGGGYWPIRIYEQKKAFCLKLLSLTMFPKGTKAIEICQGGKKKYIYFFFLAASFHLSFISISSCCLNIQRIPSLPINRGYVDLGSFPSANVSAFLGLFQISKYYKPSAPFKDPNVQMVHRFH